MADGQPIVRTGTIVVGAGQAGLATGFHLARRGLPFLILDGHARVGDAWRNRWDSLRLFTPRRHSGLEGLPLPGPAHTFPSKDEMADYLEAYAERFDLPVRTGVTVECLERVGEHLVVTAGDQRFEADNVVVAMASFQVPWTPGFAAELDPAIVQLHASQYRNPSQLQPGGVLVVGTGNSGAEIAVEVVAGQHTYLAGDANGQLPFRADSLVARRVLLPLQFRVIGHHLLTVDTALGRRVRPQLLAHAAPLVRVRRDDLAAAGVERVPRVTGVARGAAVLADGRTIDVASVIWCTGYRPDFSWIQLPVVDEGAREPRHHRGIVGEEPGLYFVGLFFLYAMSSGFLPGVGRDADHIATHIAARVHDRAPAIPVIT